MKLKLLGTGSAIPELKLTNADLSTVLDTDDEWIRERTGIGSRHIAVGEDATTMAVRASKKALEAAGISAEEIDAIIVSTTSGSDLLPATACIVQRELGAKNAFAFDISVACTGFITGLTTALGYMEMGMCKTVLVVGTECLSKIMNWNDRGSCILFGDGAGACIVTGHSGKGYKPVIHTNGKDGGALTCRQMYAKDENLRKIIKIKLAELDNNEHNRELKEQYEAALNEQENVQVAMDGKAVFQFAVRQVPNVINEVLKLNEVEPDSIDRYVLHQANRRIIESIAKRLKQPENKFPTNVFEYGNTSSASIPILMDQLIENGELTAGMKICIAGFGAGLTWGAMIIDL